MKKLKEQEKVFFKTTSTFEVTEVVEINKANNTASLKNKVMVERKSETSQFNRPDGKPGFALKVTPETQELYDKYLLFHQVKQALESFQSTLKKGYEAQELPQLKAILEALKK